MNIKETMMTYLKDQLFEGLNDPYDRTEDKNVPKMTDKRKPVITLRKLNQLKKMRNAKLEELAQESIFAPYLYGPAEEQPEGGEMGGFGGL